MPGSYRLACGASCSPCATSPVEMCQYLDHLSHRLHRSCRVQNCQQGCRPTCQLQLPLLHQPHSSMLQPHRQHHQHDPGTNHDPTRLVWPPEPQTAQQAQDRQGLDPPQPRRAHGQQPDTVHHNQSDTEVVQIHERPWSWSQAGMSREGETPDEQSPAEIIGDPMRNHRSFALPVNCIGLRAKNGSRIERATVTQNPTENARDHGSASATHAVVSASV